MRNLQYIPVWNMACSGRGYSSIGKKNLDACLYEGNYVANATVLGVQNGVFGCGITYHHSVHDSVKCKFVHAPYGKQGGLCR